MKRKAFFTLVLGACGVAAPLQADPVTAAIAAGAASSVITTSSAVYMKKQGMQPQVVDTNMGPVAVPGGSQVQNGRTQPDYYARQRASERQKDRFMQQ